MTTVSGWVTQWTEKIEKEFRAGNSKAIYDGVKTLCDTKKPFTTKQSTLTSKGERIQSPEELAEVWKKFLDKKFSATELEKLRDEFEALPENNENGELEAYIMPMFGAGLWDWISAFVALSPDLNTVKGIAFDHKQETLRPSPAASKNSQGRSSLCHTSPAAYIHRGPSWQSQISWDACDSTW